jgi:hypothetical protein
MRASLALFGLILGLALVGPQARAEGPTQAQPAKPGAPAPMRDEKGESINIINCEACVKVSAQVMSRGREIAKYIEEKGTLPGGLRRMTSKEIASLLRGKSWSSAVLTGGPSGKEYQRLVQFDEDNGGRWLNFYGGRSGYSTQCRFETEEDLLCLACTTERAECSALFEDKDKTLIGYDPELNKLEVLDWIQKGRWDNNRFLVFR